MPTIAQIAAQARARVPGAPGPAAPAGGTTVREIAAHAAPPSAPAPLRLRPAQELERMAGAGDATARAEVSRRGAALMQARADPATYLGGARAPEPTGAERAIGFAGRRIGVPALMAGRALPGGELGYQLMRRLAPEHAGAAAGAVEESLAVSPMVPKWVPGLGGWQPVRTAMQIAPFVAGSAAGLPGFAAVGVERGLAGPVGRGEPIENVLVGGATGGLEAANIAGAFRVAGKLTPRGKWWRSLTPTQQAQRVMGLPAGPPPPPGAMQMLGEKIRGLRAGKAVGFPLPRDRLGRPIQEKFAKYGQRPGEETGIFAKRVMKSGKMTTELYQKLAGIGEAGRPQVPTRKLIQARLQNLGADAVQAAEWAAGITAQLPKVGGDVMQAALAVGVKRGLARQLADAFDRLAVRENYAARKAAGKEPTRKTVKMGDIEAALQAEAVAGRGIEAAPTGPQAKREQPAPPAPTKAAEVQARKLGIDLAAIRGTGRKGQILRKDVADAAKIRTIKEKSERVGAPLRPGTVLEQTRQALEDEGLPTRTEKAPESLEAGDLGKTVGGAAGAGEVSGAGGRQAEPPRKPPITAAGRAPLAQTGAEQPPAGQEEAVPMEVLARGAPRAAPTMQAFARLSPEELVRMLGKIPGPYGGTVAETKGVGQAVKALRQEIKSDKVDEAADRKYLEQMQTAYPDISAGGEAVGGEGGGLLGLLGDARIIYGKGVLLGVEIEEAVVGLPKAIRRHFIHRKHVREGGAGAITIEDLQMRWLTSMDVPQKAAPSTSEVFDRLMRDIKAYEAGRAEGKLSTEDALRKLARAAPEEVGEELIARADKAAARNAAIDAAREKVLAAAEPYLAVESEVQVISGGPEAEAKAAARIAAMRRQLEDLRTRAMGEQTLSQALREDVIKAAREMARRFPELGPKFLTEKLAAVDSPKQAEALIDWMQKHAAVAERRAVRLGVEKRMTQLRKTVGMLEEPYHTRVREALDAFDPARPRERTVRGIESTMAFVDENPGLEPLLPAKRLRDLARLAKKPLADLDLTELRDLDGYFEMWERLASTKGRIKIGRRLHDYFADVDKGETQILASGRDVPPHRRAEGTWRRILKRGVLDAGTVSRGMGGASDPVDRALDAEAAAAKDGMAATYLVRNLWEGERDSKKHLVSFLERVFAACEATDLPFGSKALIETMEKRVTVELPTATDMAGRKRVGRVTLSAAELAETVLDYEDPNTVRQASLAGDCWGMPRTKDLSRPGPTDPKIRLGPQDVAALRDALAGRPKVQQITYALHEIYNDPATFRAMDDAVFELDMRHLIKEGPYHPRSRNWQLEGPPRVPESFADMRDVFLEHLSPAQARTGTSAAVMHGNLFSKAMNHFTTVSRIIGLARAVRGAWMFLDSKAIKRAMINRHGTGLVDFYKAVIRNLMGTGITQPTTTEAVAREMMHRFAVAALGLRVQTGLRQVWSTWNTADVLGADAVALGYKNFLSHPKESLEELKEASPIAWLRLHYYGGTAALLSGPSAAIERQYGKKTLGERSLVLVRKGDALGVGALWEAAKAWGAKNGVTDREVLGRLWEDLLNEEGAGPSTGETYQSLLATEARRSVLARIGTFFGNFRNRIVNKIWKRVIDVRNDPGNPEAWKKLFRALVVVLLGTTATMVGVGAGTRWVLSGGKRRPTGTSLALDAIENSVGNIYLMGDAFYTGRRILERGTVYGAGTRQNPLARVVTSWIQGAGGVYLGVDQAISGERYKAGVRKGQRKSPRTLGRAASSLLEAVGYSLGLPVAPLSYWRSALRFAEGEGKVAGAKEGGADTEALAWKASGEGAGAAAAVEKLKAAGITYAEARRTLRRRLEEEGVGVRERVDRLRRLGEVWREGGVGSRERPRSFGLGRRGAFSGAGSRQNMRFPDFLRKTVPAVGAEKRA